MTLFTTFKKHEPNHVDYVEHVQYVDYVEYVECMICMICMICMCMYVQYTSIHIYTYAHILIYTYTYIYIYIHMHMNKHLLKSRKYIHTQQSPLCTFSVRSRTSVVSSPSPVSSTEDCGAVLSIDLKWLEVANGANQDLLVPHWSCSKVCIVNPSFLIHDSPSIRPEQRLDFSTTRVSPASFFPGTACKSRFASKVERTLASLRRDARNLWMLSLKNHVNGGSQQQILEHSTISKISQDKLSLWKQPPGLCRVPRSSQHLQIVLSCSIFLREIWAVEDVSKTFSYMGVSLNGGFSPQIIHFYRVFHSKPSILGYHHFRKPPYPNTVHTIQHPFSQLLGGDIILDLRGITAEPIAVNGNMLLAIY